MGQVIVLKAPAVAHEDGAHDAHVGAHDAHEAGASTCRQCISPPL
jgi:hypothetical protein